MKLFFLPIGKASVIGIFSESACPLMGMLLKKGDI